MEESILDESNLSSDSKLSPVDVVAIEDNDDGDGNILFI